jgi:hypothetical protein
MKPIMHRTRRMALAASLLVAVCSPAAAHVATVSYEGDSLVYRAAPGEKNASSPARSRSATT